MGEPILARRDLPADSAWRHHDSSRTERIAPKTVALIEAIEEQHCEATNLTLHTLANVPARTPLVLELSCDAKESTL